MGLYSNSTASSQFGTGTLTLSSLFLNGADLNKTSATILFNGAGGGGDIIKLSGTTPDVAAGTSNINFTLPAASSGKLWEFHADSNWTCGTMTITMNSSGHTCRMWNTTANSSEGVSAHTWTITGDLTIAEGELQMHAYDADRHPVGLNVTGTVDIESGGKLVAHHDKLHYYNELCSWVKTMGFRFNRNF